MHILILIILLTSFSLPCSSQVERGYLIQCYNTRDDKDTSSYSYLFSLFLEEQDYRNMDIDTLFIDGLYHNYFFSKQLQEFFKMKPSFVEDFFVRRDIVDTSCHPFVKISSFSSDGLIKTIKIDNNYMYVVRINKAIIGSCELRPKNDYELIFKRKIALFSLSLLPLSEDEKIILSEDISKIQER